MSADNYLLILKENKYWVGYIESATVDSPTYKRLVFKVDTLEDAVRHGQKTETEYGIRFAEEEQK